MHKYALFVLFFCLSSGLAAQEKLNLKFGKITEADFKLPANFQDSNANAVVLSDIGNTEFVGNNSGWFTMVFTRIKKVLIRNKNGFNAADLEVSLYTNEKQTEALNNLKANTYNVENGSIVTTKFDVKSLFEEKVNKHYIKKKCTFPAVKEGSIVEFSYEIRSDFIFNLQPWSFQGEYPVLWSEYNLALPEFFNYVQLSQGYLPFFINSSKERFAVYNVREMVRADITSQSESYSLSTNVHDLKWVIKDVPAMKLEKFTSTINNHLSKIEFQLSEYRFPGQPVKEIMASWPKVVEELNNRDDFGIAYNKPNGWLNDDLKQLLQGVETYEDKIRKIYAFVRDNFTCTQDYGLYVSQNSLKEVYRKRTGTVADLNLLMLAMLRYAEIPSNPVILSLRNRGYVHPIYPLMDRFNYLIVEAKTPSSNFYLDASRPFLGFNQLDKQLYNGNAWVIHSDNASHISFLPDSLKESKVTNVYISNEGVKGLEGRYSAQLGRNGSAQLREQVAKNGLLQLEKDLQKTIIGDIKLSNLEIDSLKALDELAKLNFDLSFKPEEDILYINPLFGEAVKENPFSADQRQYPIEMPYALQELYVLNMEIPDGYQTDEIPKSARFLMDGNDGMFEYIIGKTSNRIQLRMKLQINRATFGQEDYEALREFYTFVIKKQSEQIVLKKIRK